MWYHQQEPKAETDVGEEARGGGDDVGGAAAAGDRKELKLAMFHASFFLTAAALFTLLSSLVSGVSRRFQILCWQTAIVAFVSAVDIVRRHMISRGLVWSVLRESGQPSKKNRSAGAARPLVTDEAAC